MGDRRRVRGKVSTCQVPGLFRGGINPQLLGSTQRLERELHAFRMLAYSPERRPGRAGQLLSASPSRQLSRALCGTLGAGRPSLRLSASPLHPCSDRKSVV